ncbi:MAG TPA: NAD(P)/FAD-dependent oxidoreductase [Burkholderiales bacterium]
MSLRDCDVLVVGLGPAGASAAAVAARAGARVLCIDRKCKVGVPVQCAEFIPLPLSPLAPAQAREQAIAGMETQLPSGARASRGFSGLMIRRDRFDQALAAAAQAAGALLWTDATLQALDASGGVARVRTAGGLREVAFRVVVGADGPHSTVAACLGLPRLATVGTRQYTVPLLKPSRDTDIWLSPDTPGGYAWLFPKGEVANLGLGLDPAHERDMKAPLDALHAALVRAGRVGPEILMRTGGPIPVGGLRPHLVEGPAVFVGDAAGFTHPITGAGIAPAVVSGERAGGAIAAYLAGNSAAFDTYDEEMREEFGPSLARGLAARRRLDAVWNTPAGMDDAVHRGGWIAFDEYYAATADGSRA